MTGGARSVPRLAFGAGIEAGRSLLPEEAAVALSFDGATQAVMMATPADLEDFAYGFALTEGIAGPAEIEAVEIEAAPRGFDLRIRLAPGAGGRLAERRRIMAGPVGCGLCGIESLEAALREIPPVPSSAFRMTPTEVMAAVAALPGRQPLHDATRAVHCAAFWTREGGIVAAREDVGRHNALDKLAGALARGPAREGAVVLTSRASIDLVQKVATMGVGILIAVSAPTADAVALAEAANLTLVAGARPDRFELFAHSDRIATEPADVR